MVGILDLSGVSNMITFTSKQLKEFLASTLKTRCIFHKIISPMSPLSRMFSTSFNN